jgi:uncharacterized protein YbjT (DUF2867 family)
MKVVVAGASGFVGEHLVRELAAQGASVVGLSRTQRQAQTPGVSWREVDLYSAKSTALGVEGAEVAIYLVHSMKPSTTLFQGDFHDTDLLLADNFARACQKHGVQRIIYLGGLVPKGHISLHLESRREVEDVLASTGVPLTVFRAGMIVGPGGSSFEILRSLVKRLPLMVLPSWTRRRTQAVFIDDVLRVLTASVWDSTFANQTLDLVNGETLRYADLIDQMGEVLGVRRLGIPFPIESTGFSKLWVSLVSGTDYQLVSPLIDSLLCDLPSPGPDPKVARLIRYPNFRSMAHEALRRAQTAEAGKRSKSPKAKRRWRTVRSIQRLTRLESKDCHWISTEYMRWLPGAFYSWIEVDVDRESGRIQFRFKGIDTPLLKLQYIHGDFDEDRMKFHIVGGLLSATEDTGWLEFRQVKHRHYTLAAIHEFVPSLPWPVYLMTQALLHSWTMSRFRAHLERVGRSSK